MRTWRPLNGDRGVFCVTAPYVTAPYVPGAACTAPHIPSAACTAPYVPGAACTARLESRIYQFSSHPLAEGQPSLASPTTFNSVQCGSVQFSSVQFGSVAFRFDISVIAKFDARVYLVRTLLGVIFFLHHFIQSAFKVQFISVHLIVLSSIIKLKVHAIPCMIVVGLQGVIRSSRVGTESASSATMAREVNVSCCILRPRTTPSQRKIPY